MDTKLLLIRINKSKQYKQDFKNVYGDSKITYEKIVNAIVEFERALTTPNSKFDQYLRGETKLSKDEKDGYILFKQYGCITCHNGINIGGNSFQKLDTFIPYSNKKVYPDRFSITHNIFDKNVFKVPTLRNIELTSPYFHDGHIKTLHEAVAFMSKHNLGIVLQEDDIKKIVAFLKTLTGETPTILKADNEK